MYGDFVNALGVDAKTVNRISQIPFLPIRFFKDKLVTTGTFSPNVVFTSSGTTGQIPSKHAVKNVTVYEQSFFNAFERSYGPVDSYCVLALLPSYLERSGSSLVYMVNALIRKSNHRASDFYLHNQDELVSRLRQLAESGTKTLLIGVSFALLELVEKLPGDFLHPNLIVMETGGMKGRRKELIREELHSILQEAFHTKAIHSEYGMTELLSQAYAVKGGLYTPPPWMKVLVRDNTDPLAIIAHEQTGGLNIIDLANQDSCAFIATEDLGKTHADGTFEVLGRFDTAEIRGCNLMAL